MDSVHFHRPQPDAGAAEDDSKREPSNSEPDDFMKALACLDEYPVGAKIRNLYCVGKPFNHGFIQDLVEQMDEAQSVLFTGKNKEFVFNLMGIDGATIAIPVSLEKEGDHAQPPQQATDIQFDMGIWSCKDLIEDAICPLIPEDYRGKASYLALEVLSARRPRNPNPSKFLSLEETRARMKQAVADFNKSDTWKWVVTMLEGLESLPRIDKMVAFACGLPSERAYGMRHAMQHAFMLRLGAWFAERQGRNVECYTQELIWYDVDRQVLIEAGYIVMDNPRAFLEVNSNSVVFNFNALRIPPVVFELGKPGLLFCNTFTDTPVDMTFKEWQDTWTGDEDDYSIPLLTDLRINNIIRNHYSRHEMPQSEYFRSGYGISLYARHTGEQIRDPGPWSKQNTRNAPG